MRIQKTEWKWLLSLLNRIVRCKLLTWGIKIRGYEKGIWLKKQLRFWDLRLWWKEGRNICPSNGVRTTHHRAIFRFLLVRNRARQFDASLGRNVIAPYEGTNCFVNLNFSRYFGYSTGTGTGNQNYVSLDFMVEGKYYTVNKYLPWRLY